MLAVASLKRSLEFDPVEQGVKRKRAEIKLSSSTHLNLNGPPAASLSPSKQQQQQQILSPTRSTSPKISKSSSASTSTDDTPLFTSAQTAQMCARLLRDQDQAIRQQYEELLKSKLNEQYDAFIRYSHDSVHKQRSNVSSMLFNYNENAQESKQQMDFSYVS